MHLSFAYDPPDEFTQLLDNWRLFINQREMHPTVVPFIGASWLRCQPFLNPTDLVTPTCFSPDHLQAARASSADLIALSLPVMEDIYQFVEGSNSALVLANSACCLMQAVGDPSMLERLDRLGFVPGAFSSEQQIGTNSIALAVSERMPVQVRGAEHFLRQYHDIATAAAPIFSSSGRLLGVFSILTDRTHYSRHMIGMAVAGANAIANQRQTETLLAEQNSQLAQVNGILGSITEGVLVWNQDGLLQHVNPAAERMLDMPAQALLGRHFRNYFSFPPFLDESLHRREALENVSGRIHIGDHVVHALLSLHFTHPVNGEQSIILSMHRETELLELATQRQSDIVLRTLDSLEGESAATRRIRKLARLAAAARASVLIRGERGTGKTLLANAIHNASLRSEEPFVTCFCASLPREMMMVDLVGVEKGFSNKDPWGQPGKIELANGGTLYLQNIDALNLECQDALLNLLELGIVQRLGKSRPTSVDVRVVASTTADLEKLIEVGQFRGDLYYRLSPFEIRMLPLREREEDLPHLVDSLLLRLSSQLMRRIRIHPDALALLRGYSWPNNINELRAVLSRVANQLQGQDEILPEHLPEFIQNPFPLHFENFPSLVINSLDEMEREALVQAARACKGHLGKMSQALGVSRTTLWRKVKQYQISVGDYRGKYERGGK